MNQNAAKTARKLLPLYRETLDPFSGAVAEMASCKKGCTHCCHNLVETTLIEAALIADHVLHSGKWSKEEIVALKKELIEQSDRMESMQDATAKEDKRSLKWLASKTPCAFLSKEGTCRVYELRPGACRVYYVVSDPENCSPDRPGAEVAFIDSSPAVDPFIQRLVPLGGDHIPLLSGSLQDLMLAAFELLRLSPRDFRDWMSKADIKTESHGR